MKINCALSLWAFKYVLSIVILDWRLFCTVGSKILFIANWVWDYFSSSFQLWDYLYGNCRWHLESINKREICHGQMPIVITGDVKREWERERESGRERERAERGREREIEEREERERVEEKREGLREINLSQPDANSYYWCCKEWEREWERVREREWRERQKYRQT